MIFVHIKKNEELRMHKLEMIKTLHEVLEGVRQDFGEWIDRIDKSRSTRLVYDDMSVFVTYSNEK